MAKDADASKKGSPPRFAGFRLTIPGEAIPDNAPPSKPLPPRNSGDGSGRRFDDFQLSLGGDTPPPSAAEDPAPMPPARQRRGKARPIAIGVIVGCAAAIALLIAERNPSLRSGVEPTAAKHDSADAAPGAALAPPATDAGNAPASPSLALTESPPQQTATLTVQPNATGPAPESTAAPSVATPVEASKEAAALRPAEPIAPPPPQESAGSSALPTTEKSSSVDAVGASAAGSSEVEKPLRVAARDKPDQPRNADCDKCPEIVMLPGGSFSMGSRDDPSEQPVHVVTVQRFAIGKYPVTIGEWKFCVFARDCPEVKVAGNDETPIHNVSWEDARAYVAWLSRLTGQRYRLPSEAEWEYAARGGTDTRYWWGAERLRNVANCKDCSDNYDPQRPAVTGTFKPNPFGLYDTNGTIAQWVEDCWHHNYQNAPTDGSPWQAENCRTRVLRGGSWKSGWDYLRSASRDSYDQNVRYITHGFRVAVTPQ